MPLSRNLGALTSWNPLGLSRPVMGLLYLYLYNVSERVQNVASVFWSHATQTRTNETITVQ